MNKKILVIIYPIVFLLSLILIVSCIGGAPFTKMNASQNTTSILSDLLPGKFGKLWVERTIQLKTTIEESQNPSGMMGGPGGGFFPLFAQATFIDSFLMECGMNEFENLSEMSKEEKQQYEKIYNQTYRKENNYFIWLELQTPYTKELLDLNRWTFYLEDEKGSKYDPQEILEYSIETNKNPLQNSIPANRDSIENKFQNWKISSKTVLLYFPKVNIYSKKIIDINTKTITLVAFNWGSKNFKNEGTWDVKFLNQKSNI